MAQQPDHPRHSGDGFKRSPLLIGWIATVLILVIGGLIAVFMVTRSAEHVTDSLVGAFKPTVNSTTVIQGAITSVKGGSTNGKLQVLTANIDVKIDKQKETRTLWDQLYLGTTTVELSVTGNRVQYVLPLGSLTAADFHYDTHDRALRVKVASPYLDEELVDVQSDPTKINERVAAGWASLKSMEGKTLGDQARKELRACVIRKGQDPLVQNSARESAREVLAVLLQAQMAGVLGEGVRIEVDFTRPAESH